MWDQPIPSLAEEQLEHQGGTVGVQELNTAKAHFWGELWEARQEPPQQAAWWPELLRRAQQQEALTFEIEDVKTILRRFRSRIGLGGDRLNPRWLLQLPDEGLCELAGVLRTVEERLRWPQSMMEVITQLLPKSETADRPITLTQGLYRIWSVARRDQVSRWSSRKARHWDRAVAGSSALRAAILRQTRLEVASCQDFAWDQVLWDIEKFYDHIQVQEVVGSP